MAERWNAQLDPCRLVWSATVDPSVVVCAAEPVAVDHPDALDISQLALATTTIIGTSGGEHLAISDGTTRIRLDVVDGTLLRGPVRLHYRLAGFADAEQQLLTLRRLLALHRLGRFARGLYHREIKAERWAMMLRAHDLSVVGASQREIAAALFGPQATDEWRTQSDYLRLRIQRLLRDANGLIHGGYLDVLRGSNGIRSDASR